MIRLIYKRCVQPNYYNVSCKHAVNLVLWCGRVSRFIMQATSPCLCFLVTTCDVRGVIE